MLKGISSMTKDRIHATAIISKEAEIANDVVIGPFAVIDGTVRIGNGCVLGPFSAFAGRWPWAVATNFPPGRYSASGRSIALQR